MHPEFVANIAKERHEQLLATAERHRRARRARSRATVRPAAAGGRAADTLARVRRLLLAIASPIRRSAPDPCSC